jgi:hypothetical protein
MEKFKGLEYAHENEMKTLTTPTWTPSFLTCPPSKLCTHHANINLWSAQCVCLLKHWF